MKYKNKKTGEQVDAHQTTSPVAYSGLIVPSGHWIIDGKPFTLSNESFTAEYEVYARPEPKVRDTIAD